MIWLALFMAVIGIRLVWIIWKLSRHPQMERLVDAIPSIAPLLEQLITKIAACAGVEPPPVYILRARLPNAFTFSPFRKRRLILTDELLEEADQQADGIQYLEQIICHELAHISLGHGSKFFALKVLEILLPVPYFHTRVEQRLQSIEQEADKLASALVKQLHQES